MSKLFLVSFAFTGLFFALYYFSWEAFRLRIPSQLLHNSQENAYPPFVRRIVAVGDLHSDYTNAVKVLHFAGVVDDLGNWDGGVDYFVQTGDIIDRRVTSVSGNVMTRH